MQTENSASSGVDEKKAGLSRSEILLYAIPIILIGGLLATYFASPLFYLRYVLYKFYREYQFVEIVTFVSTGAAAAFLFGALARAKKYAICETMPLLFILGMGLAALFFAGEEVSWGQSLMFWETPEAYRDLSAETNLHNTDLPIASLGSVFLICVFFILPWWRKLKKKVPFIGDADVLPRGPAIFCMACAFLWKGFKSVYRAVFTEPEQAQSAFYNDFIEQINEQKEMLVAVALLIFAIRIFSQISRKSRQ